MPQCHKCKIKKLFFCCLLILNINQGIAGINEAIAKDYFVAVSNGKDTNVGTKDSPFLTLEKGVTVLIPGDTLYVRGGTYIRNDSLWNSPSGTSWINAITIKAFQNEKVIIKPLPSTNFPGNSVFYFKENTHYVIMDGLTVDGTNGAYGYRMGTGSHHIRVSNGEIKNTPNSAIQGSGAHYIEIINVKAHDSWTGVDAWDVNNRSYGFYLNGDYNLIKNCDFYNNHGYGIHIYSGTREPSYNRIINNRIHNNGQAGIIVTGGTNNQIINNLFWNNERGIQVDYGATNTVVYHNTFYLNKKEELLVGPNSHNSFVKNNLLVGTGNYPVLNVLNGSGASKIENNLIIGGSTDPKKLLNIEDGSAFSKGNLIGGSYTHGLKNPANSDFHITETSSAIGAGLVLTEVTMDMDGVFRNSTSGYDLGAYQFNGAKSMDPPTALRVLN